MVDSVWSPSKMLLLCENCCICFIPQLKWPSDTHRALPEGQMPPGHLPPAWLQRVCALHSCQLAFLGVGGVPCREFGWVPCGAHPGAGALLGKVTGEWVNLYSGHPAGELCSGSPQCPRADAWQAGAIFGRCHLVPSPDAAASCPQSWPCRCVCSSRAPASPSPAPHRTLLLFFHPSLLFFPAGCEKVPSACDRSSSLPSPFLLVKTAILEQPGGLVKGYL